MKDDVKENLREQNIWFTENNNLKEITPAVDIIYQTRAQKERGDDSSQPGDSPVVNQEILNLMKKEAIIMHPLPRVDEISKEVDSDPRAAYFRQAENGLYIRMALLKMILT